MRFDNISITLPPGYLDSLEQESKRYGLNRSEFIRTLFDGYLRVTAEMILSGEREWPINRETKLEEFFPDVLPHRKAEANKWLGNYLRLILKITKESGEHKKKTGSVDRNSVWDVLPREEPTSSVDIGDFGDVHR